MSNRELFKLLIQPMAQQLLPRPIDRDVERFYFAHEMEISGREIREMPSDFLDSLVIGKVRLMRDRAEENFSELMRQLSIHWREINRTK